MFDSLGNPAGTNNVTRDHYAWCPLYFTSVGSTQYGLPWPYACENGETGIIRITLRQVASCIKEGNPCIPSTGNKEVHEADFRWGGLTFARHYNSVRNVPAFSQMGDNWSHSLSWKLILQIGGINPPVYVQDDQNHIDKYSFVASDSYRSENEVGNILVRNLDGGGGIASWTLKLQSGRELVFDTAGRLDKVKYVSKPEESLLIHYCDLSSFTNAECNNIGAMTDVADAKGRTLTFRYSESVYPDAGISVQMNPSRLVEIEADGQTQVSYAYDDVGRLISTTYPGASGPAQRVLVYGESNHVCREGNGDASPTCPDGGFPEHLTGITDENGTRYADYYYDGLGRVTASAHAHGAEKISLKYLTDQLVEIKTPLGDTRTHEFEPGLFHHAGNTLDGNGLVQRHYTDGRIDSLIDARGAEIRFGYDAYGLTVRTNGADSPEEQRIETTWDTTFRVPIKKLTFNASHVLEAKRLWTYSARGQLKATCEIDPTVSGAGSYACDSALDAPDGVRQTSYTYCESIESGCPIVGLLKSSNGARHTNDGGMAGLDDITTYTYRMLDDPTCASNGACTYRKGDLWKVTNALGQVTETVKYDKSGRPLRIKDSNGTLTDLTYHPRGWLVDRIVRQSAGGIPSSNDATTHIDYDAVGNVTRVTQPDGAYLSYTYDDAHRLIKISDNLNNSIDYCPTGVGTADCLDAAGNRLVEITKAGNAIKRTLRRTYNQLGQLSSVLNHDDVATLTYPTGDGYDANGNATNSSDGLSVKTHQDYDPLNRLKTTIQDYLGTDPDTGGTTTGYVYDARDNLRTVTDPDGLATNYDYDGLNNLTSLHSPDTGTTGYTYDRAGNRITQTDARGITSTYTYDALNRITAISYPSGTENVGFAYDQANSTTGCTGSYPQGRLTTMTDPSGQTTYCYDRRGNVLKKTQLTAGVTLVVAYTYTLADRLASLTYPSGAIVSYVRDAVGRIVQVKRKVDAASANVTIVSNASWNPFGPLNTLTYGNGRTLTKSYDQDYAIDKVVSSDPNGLVLDFSTDVMGNIKDASNSVGPAVKTRKYLYDNLYRLSRVDTGSDVLVEDYAYNKTGDRTLKQLGAQAPQVYTYLVGTHRLGSVDGTSRTLDNNGNLISIDSGRAHPEFTFNERNRMSASLFNGATRATYALSGRGERVAKLDPQGKDSRVYAYDEAGHLLGDYPATEKLFTGDENLYLDDMPVAITISGALSYLETDHLGTPRIAANPATNAQQWKWDFFADAFGGNAATIAPSGGIDVKLRYPGQQFDSETGLHYNYFRDYEAGTGRYVESDPIGLRGGISTYGYVRSRPMRLVDPTGLFTVDQSCKDCAAGVPEISKQAQQWCDTLKTVITDRKLKQCINRRCKKAKIKCRDCAPDELGYETQFGPFRSSTANLCAKNFPAGSQAFGPVVIHEWAHSCGWDHNGGAGVPGNDGTSDPMTGE